MIWKPGYRHIRGENRIIGSGVYSALQWGVSLDQRTGGGRESEIGRERERERREKAEAGWALTVKKEKVGESDGKGDSEGNPIKKATREEEEEKQNTWNWVKIHS